MCINGDESVPGKYREFVSYRDTCSRLSLENLEIAGGFLFSLILIFVPQLSMETRKMLQVLILRIRVSVLDMILNHLQKLRTQEEEVNCQNFMENT